MTQGKAGDRAAQGGIGSFAAQDRDEPQAVAPIAIVDLLRRDARNPTTRRDRGDRRTADPLPGDRGPVVLIPVSVEVWPITCG
jgi:hypothetical protein